MTPNGGILLGAVILVGAMAARSFTGLAVLLGLLALFAVVEIGSRAAKALLRSAAIVLPLAGFMLVVWVGVVGRSPGEIAAGVAGTRNAALTHVGFICLRLFLIALAIQLVVLRFAHLTPLRFVSDMTAPRVVKKLVILTFSLLDTVFYAVDRARTALIAAGLIAARISLKNAMNGWVLVQTVWLAVIAIAIGRLRDKWPIEDTLGRLDIALTRPAVAPAPRDFCWFALSLVAALVAGFA